MIFCLWGLIILACIYSVVRVFDKIQLLGIIPSHTHGFTGFTGLQKGDKSCQSL